MNRFLLFLMLAPAMAWCEAPEWQQKLSPPKPGDFPAPRALKATYRFGWMNLIAAEADAVFFRPKRDVFELDVSGGTTGFVRSLWKMDATHKAVTEASTLHPIRAKQTEIYASKTIKTYLAFNPQSVTSLRVLSPPDLVAPKKQKFFFSNLYDLQSALLYVRSQRLEPGDHLSLVAFPANTPYLATIDVLQREKIQVKAGKYNALKLEIHLYKITPALTLEPHKKFKRAYAWISDDSDRILLRVEAEIFVGSVWVELQSVKFTGP